LFLSLKCVDVEHYSLEEITGIGGRIPPFATDEESMPYIEQSIENWMEWYEQNKKKS
jgi:hypothetical protein